MLVKTLSALSALCILGAVYFATDLFLGEPEIGELIVLPIYVGFGLILSACFALVAFIVWFFGTKKKR